MNLQIKPITTEKAVLMIEAENTLTFQTEKRATKKEIEKEIESLFNVKIEKIRTLIRGNKKNAYVRLKKEFQALDVATKLGIM
jgi:ribosomal protein L23